MPLRLMLLFVVLTPLAGIIQVENGAYGANVAVWGYPNGASYAFAFYGLCAFAGAWLVTRGAIFAAPRPSVSTPTNRMRKASLRLTHIALVVNGLLCIVTLFVFGSFAVLTGDVAKGEFRSSLGGLGALAFLTLKWFAPSVFAFACAVYSFAGRPTSARPSLILLGLVTFVIGLSWGFKTSGLVTILPGLIVLLWAAPMRKIVYSILLGFGAILLAFTLFDTLEGTTYGGVLEFLLARATVYQGDVSWYIWDMWVSNTPLPDYGNTLLVVVGDRLFSLFSGITRADPERWILAHYGSLLTYTIGYPIEGIEAGHSVTGTPFSEGVIAAGAIGVPIFGLAAGAVAGFVYRQIATALGRRNPVGVALWCNYSVFGLFSWLNGGDIVQLFHVAVIVGAALCWLVLRTLYSLARARPVSHRPYILQAST